MQKITQVNPPKQSKNSTPVHKPHKAKPTPPALRLVSTKGMSREDWLQIRKQGIGASDAAAAIGLNPYQLLICM
jgi:hypothetical protein